VLIQAIWCLQNESKIKNLLLQFGWEQEHPPYGLDLAPSHFHLFPALTETLSEYHFTCDEDI
jgi:hypothetical protein